MTTVNVYLTFEGNCEEAFEFYKSVFGGEYQGRISRFGEMPPQNNMPPIPDSQKDRIMHIGLPISKETSIMGSDSYGEYAGSTLVGNNFSISINTESREEAERLFNGLSSGGKVTMPMAITFWDAYFGMFTDKFGINWRVNHDIEPM